MAVGLAVAGLVTVFSGAAVLLTSGSAGSTPPTVDDPCVPSKEWTEKTDWLTAPPAGEGWKQIEQRVVIDRAAYDEQVLVTPEVPAVPAVWANFSPNDQQATFIGPPTWPTDPRGTWNIHDEIPGGHEGPDGVYSQGNPDKGGNWFYRQAAKPAVPAVYETVHHEAVTHQEFIYQRVHPAVVCQTPTTAPTTTPPTPPEVEPSTATATPSPSPEATESPEVIDAPEAAEAPEVLPAEASLPPSPSAQVPTTVDAGYAGDTGQAVSGWGIGLLAAGLLLLTSGLIVATRKA